jgi:WD40 repeat protein
MAGAPGGVSFHREVLPIFRAACVGCHGEKNPSSGLNLTSYVSLMRGGKGGAPVVPGKSGDSRLVKYLLGTLQPKMPVGGALKTAEIDRIRQWIDAGAKVDAPIAATGAPAAPAMPMFAAPTPVTALAFSPDNKTLAVGAYKEVQFWDVETRRLAHVWRGHADTIHALVFSRDGKWLAAGGGTPGVSGEVRLWDVGAGREARILGEHTDVVNALAFDPKGSRIASGSVDKTIRVWEVATGKALATLRDHSDAVWGVAYSPDGKYLVSSSADRSVKVWDAATWKRLYSIAAHEDTVYAVEFSPDGRSLLSSSGDQSAKVWTFGPESSGLARVLAGHHLAVLAATFAPDGKVVATASADKSVKLWTAADGKNTITLGDPKDWVYTVRFSPDRKHLAAGTWSGDVLLWNAADGKLEGALSTMRFPPPANAIDTETQRKATEEKQQQSKRHK